MFQWNQTYIVNSGEGIEKVTHKGLGETIRIPGATELVKSGIVEVRKAPYVEPVKGSVSLTLPATGSAKTLRRIKLYVRLAGSNNPYFANDYAFKGKPFIYEYRADKTAADVAKIIKSINSAYGDTFLKVSETGGTITFTGDNYTMFTEAVVEEFESIPSNVNGGVWNEAESYTKNTVVPVNGFGTYEQVLKDLRLPTTENTSWTSTTEMPVPGAKYDQYTVTYKNKVGVQGGGHVGDLVEAQTTHAFYVNQSVIIGEDSTFDKLFDKVITLNETPSKNKDNEWNESTAQE